MGNLQKIHSVCLCVLQMTTLSLKNRDTRRAANQILNLDDPRADVLTAAHPWRRQGLALAEHAASSGAGHPRPGHRATQTQVGARVREQHTTEGTVPALSCFLAPRRARSAVATSGGLTGNHALVLPPVLCLAFHRCLLRLPARSSKNYLCINVSARAGCKRSTSVGDVKQKGNFLYLLITHTWALNID